MKTRAFFMGIFILMGLSLFLFLARAAMSPATCGLPPQEQLTPTVIKGFISQMKEQLEKDNSQFPELILRLEKYTSNLDSSAYRAVLSSMIAEMYQNQYRQDRWKIDQRTELGDYVPDDIREWTTGLFERKIGEQLSLSLKPEDLLRQTSLAAYQEILDTKDYTESLYPSLYDFLMDRAIRIQPSVSLYDQWLLSLNERHLRELYVDVALKRLAFLNSQGELDDERYWSDLQDLETTNSGLLALIPIYLAQIDHLNGQEWRVEPEERDSVIARRYGIIQKAVRQFPDEPRANELRNQLMAMENPTIQVNHNWQVYPGESLDLRIEYKNTPKLVVRLYESLANPEDRMIYNQEDKKKYRGKLVDEATFEMFSPDVFLSRDTILSVPVKKLGLYELEVSTPDGKVKVYDRFSVSRLAMVVKAGPDNTEAIVTDFRSGKPVAGASVYSYKYDKDKGAVLLNEVKTNSLGVARLVDLDAAAIRPAIGEDRYSMCSNSGLRYYAYTPEEVDYSISLFTDRGIYRPGQTLYFKGIVYNTDRDHPRVIPDRTVKVILRDANGKEVATRELRSNGFGSFNGEFALPKSGLNGVYRIEVERYSASFRVEEYKRPSFHLDFQPLTDEVVYNRPLRLEGTAMTYSGVALSEGMVKWRIRKRPLWWRSSYFVQKAERQVAAGEVALSADGKFQILFTPEREKGAFDVLSLDHYEVIATLTDSKGESQEAHYSFSVSDNGMYLTLDMADKMVRDSAVITVKASTVNGEPVAAKGNYTLYLLEDKRVKPDNNGGPVIYPIRKMVRTGQFTADTPISPLVTPDMESGRYRIEARAFDRNGKQVEVKRDFILYDLADKRPPVFSETWLLCQQTTCAVGEEVRFLFGTSFKDTYVYYEMYDRTGKTLSRELLRMSDENRQFTFPYEERFGEGVTVSLWFVKEQRLYQESIGIRLRRPDRQLTIRPVTFRDHLLPGSQESWTFQIKDADSAFVESEVLASLYDASLDAIHSSVWSFSPVSYVRLSQPRLMTGNNFSTHSEYGAAEMRFVDVPVVKRVDLEWQGVLSLGYLYTSTNQVFLTGGLRVRGAAAPPMAKSVQADAAAVAKDEAVLEEAAVVSSEMSAIPQSQTAGNTATVRRNLNETAFFYPVLRTDTATGQVEVRFTMPESNTTWNLRLLAQTKDLKYGLYADKVTTSKPLMVIPNLPRFLRRGDDVTITAQIVNQSDGAMNGRARIELFNPETDEPVICLTKSQKPFDLAAGETSTVSWRFMVPDYLADDLLGCRIVADAEQGSDGEQHWLPVLSDRILVTESRPFFLDEKGDKTLRLPVKAASELFRLTMEVNANPVWMAVQALPTLTEPKQDNALAWFAAYYSNTLASYIVKAHPRIQAIVERWSAAGGDAGTMLSELERNEELKAVLLEETPWVLEARDDSERKRRLALLFDLNRANAAREAALARLLEAQDEKGGWSWFKGMPASRSVTLSILQGMARLTELGAVEYGEAEKRAQIAALRFLDERIRSDYDRLTEVERNDQKSGISLEQVDYLTVRYAYRDIPVMHDAMEAIRFYTTIAERDWQRLPLAALARFAMMEYQSGKKAVLEPIMAWLRKTATISDEKGMYWANNRQSTGFLDSPISAQAALIRLFLAVEPESESVDAMKRWLLSQKRTQAWESEPASLDAVYALLLNGGDWLSTENTCVVEWAGKSYDSSEGEVGTGYMKLDLPINSVDGKETTVTLRKSGEAPAWGALYEQSFKKLDEVESQANGLSVEKKFFIESQVDGKRVLLALSDDRPLKVGDKLVTRLTIRSDQPYDYVCLKDERAGCLEPLRQVSGAIGREGVWYYQSPKTASENFFFERLPQGTFVIEYSTYVTRAGEYAAGPSTLQCLYAPEFVAYGRGSVLNVE